MVDEHVAAETAAVVAEEEVAIGDATLLCAAEAPAQNGHPWHLHQLQCSEANAAPHQPKQPAVFESPSMVDEHAGALAAATAASMAIRQGIAC